MTLIKNNTFKTKHTHLSVAERRMIQMLLRKKESHRSIAYLLNRSPQTINNEVKRGIITKRFRLKVNKKQSTVFLVRSYSHKKGQACYELKRKNCGRKYKWISCVAFIEYVTRKIAIDKWSPDAIVGYAKRHQLFSDDEMLSVKTLYHLIDAGFLGVKNIDLNKKVSRQIKKQKSRKNKRILGQSIEKRPDIVDVREELGHWEIDTVVGLKNKADAVLLTVTERKTRFEFILKVEGKQASFVNKALLHLKKQCGSYFGALFKTITADNGKEFSGINELLKDTLAIYFTHPYSSWERGTNENHNGIIRRFIPKGRSVSDVSDQLVQRIQTWMNNLPRRILGFQTPKELFLEEITKLQLFTN
ncbi:IS30 family transposase [Brochothrix campestris]|uniref:IS30 family transposase n=1 Tax=Brochothrix campestris TaxID=2757 RepID=UPI0038CFA3B8